MIRRLRIDDLALARGGRRLLSGLSFELSAGAAVALTGPNGAGKTTLLRAIAGFVRPESGVIAFEGEAGALEAEDARTSHIHFLGHQDALKTSRTAREELMFQVRWTGGDDRAAMAAAEALHLTRLFDLEVRKLSAGQRRRLALARVIASRRALWLLDEPLAPLDAAHRALVGELMASHLANGGLMVAATHDPLPVGATAVTVGA